jgi:predicted anti-sigma-YlaC factor YlaD
MSSDEIVCRELVELAGDYLEAALPASDLELAEEHLAICAFCREYVDQLAATAAAVAATAPDAPADDAVRALVGAFAARTRNGRAPTSPRA